MATTKSILRRGFKAQAERLAEEYRKSLKIHQKEKRKITKISLLDNSRQEMPFTTKYYIFIYRKCNLYFSEMIITFADKKIKNLIFEPLEKPIPTDKDGKYIWIEIKAVEIIEITDYHKEG